MIKLEEVEEFYNSLAVGMNEPDLIVCSHQVYTWIRYIQDHPIIAHMGNYAKRSDGKWHKWYGMDMDFDPARLPL